MKPRERQLVLNELAVGEARLLELVDGLMPVRWSFREAPQRWSIAENIEHIVVLENFIIQRIAEVLRAA